MSTDPAASKRQAFRDGLAAPKPFVAVGAHDALTAQLVGSYGFDAFGPLAAVVAVIGGGLALAGRRRRFAQ